MFDVYSSRQYRSLEPITAPTYSAVAPSPDQVRLLTRVRSKRGVYLQVHFAWFESELPNIVYSNCIQKLCELGGSETNQTRLDCLFIGHDLQSWNSLGVWFFPNTHALLALIRSREFMALTAHAKNALAMVMVPNPAVSQRWLNLGHKLMPRLTSDQTSKESTGGMQFTGLDPNPVQLKNFQQCDQGTPIHMFNALKFRKFADYGTHRQAVSGQQVYRDRYGRLAIACIHKSGGKLVADAQYQFTLIGANGDPRIGQWDEVVIAQYPSRQAFLNMLRLDTYQHALVHRQAALERTTLWSATPLKTGD